MDSGELKAPVKALDEKATPEQRAAWRKEQGLPENAAGYLAGLKLRDGLVPGERDKPLLEKFAADVADKHNWNQDQVNQATDWFLGHQAELNAARDKADGEFHNQTLVQLSSEWGKEAPGNLTAIANTLNLLPQDLRESLLTARLPSGRLAGDDPEFNRGILMLGNMINPASSLLPNIQGGGVASIDAKLAEHKANMSAVEGTDKWKAYWKSAPAQEEYRQLLDAKQKLQERKSA